MLINTAKTAESRRCVLSSVFALSEQTKKMKEKVDNVEVEIDRRVNVLLRRHLVHDHVGVENDEQ